MHYIECHSRKTQDLVPADPLFPCFGGAEPGTREKKKWRGIIFLEAKVGLVYKQLIFLININYSGGFHKQDSIERRQALIGADGHPARPFLSIRIHPADPWFGCLPFYTM